MELSGAERWEKRQINAENDPSSFRFKARESSWIETETVRLPCREMGDGRRDTTRIIHRTHKQVPPVPPGGFRGHHPVPSAVPSGVTRPGRIPPCRELPLSSNTTSVIRRADTRTRLPQRILDLALGESLRLEEADLGRERGRLDFRVGEEEDGVAE